ncbi:MAG TPA: hypothetical protein VMB48_13090 [Steroidobacteraceae bacterium]|nr:hypothetical protein [Steroidobacteraceae bacterium]
MKPATGMLAAVEVLLVSPAALFMASVFLKPVQPLLDTWQIVEWYARHRVLGLYMFLVAMPLAAFLIGATSVLRSWQGDAELRQAVYAVYGVLRAHAAQALIACATVIAGGMLAIVTLHMVGE